MKPELPITPQTRTLPAEPCVNCHRNFFPLGYALENFDPIGRWRTNDQLGPVDASGAFVDGTTFKGVVELRQGLLERPNAFRTTITEKLLVYSSTGTVTPSGPVFQMTGTGAISGFNVATTTMIGFPATVTGGGCFVAIPSSGIWTWTAAGNIATAGTVTAANNVPVTFCWNAATQKFIPSRIA